MNPEEKIEALLEKIGLLRGCFSVLMQAVNDHRAELQKDFCAPPPELGNLMAQSQEHFAGLLRSGKSLRATPDRRLSEEYVNQLFNETLPILAPLPKFFSELSSRSIQGFSVAASVLEDGKTYSQAALAIVDDSAKPVSLESHE